MNDIFFNTFVLIGATFILKYGKILNPVRSYLTDTTTIFRKEFFIDLFKCSLCLGFWVGLFFGLFFDGSFTTWALYSSAVCWLADHAIMIAQKHLYP